MTKERLDRAIQFLPLDKWQYDTAKKNIEHLSEEEAGQLADRLESALNELPGIVERLKTNIAEKAAKEKQEIATSSLVACIFHDKAQVKEIKQQLLEQNNIHKSDIYVAFVEANKLEPIIKFIKDFTTVELDFAWTFFSFLMGLVWGLIFDIIYLSINSTLSSIAPLVSIHIFSALLGVVIYRSITLRKFLALKNSVMREYQNRIPTDEFLFIVKISQIPAADAKRHEILNSLQKAGGKEFKFIKDNITQPVSTNAFAQIGKDD